MKEKILSPLNMNHTVLTYPEMLKTSDFASSYAERTAQLVEAGYFSNVDAIGPAGAIKSNMVDMAHWLQLQLNNGKFENKVVVSEKNLRENHTPQTAVFPAEAKYAELGFATYGMGWTLNTYRGHLRRQHNGSIEGYRSQMTIFPNDQLGVFITTNTGTAEYYFVNTITNYIVDKWLNMNQIDWNSRFKQEQAEGKAAQEKAKLENLAKRQPNAPPTHSFESYAGTYEHPGYGILTLRFNEGRLVGTLRTLPISLQHYHYDVFEGTGAFDMVKFNFAPAVNGNVERVVATIPNAGEIEFKRK